MWKKRHLFIGFVQIKFPDYFKCGRKSLVDFIFIWFRSLVQSNTSANFFLEILQNCNFFWVYPRFYQNDTLTTTTLLILLFRNFRSNHEEDSGKQMALKIDQNVTKVMKKPLKYLRLKYVSISWRSSSLG